MGVNLSLHRTEESKVSGGCHLVCSPGGVRKLRVARRVNLKPVEQPLKGLTVGEPLSQRAHDPVPLSPGDEPFVFTRRQKAEPAVACVDGEPRVSQEAPFAQAPQPFALLVIIYLADTFTWKTAPKAKTFRLSSYLLGPLRAFLFRFTRAHFHRPHPARWLD